jgi:hypothetical protein
MAGDRLLEFVILTVIFCLVFTVGVIGFIIIGYKECAHSHDVFRCQINLYWTPVERTPQ